MHTIAGWPETSWAALFQEHWRDHVGMPYEHYFGIEPVLADVGRVARGYYWANLLTEGHLATLGGAAEVSRRCDELGLMCQRVEGRDDAVMVRSRRPVNEFDDDQLRAMRDLLAPVLVIKPYRRWYAGPPLRVIKDSGTAFRHVPAEIAYPWFDDWPMHADPGQRQLVPDDEADDPSSPVAP
jgi:hypothetical protein